MRIIIETHGVSERSWQETERGRLREGLLLLRKQSRIALGTAPLRGAGREKSVTHRTRADL